MWLSNRVTAVTVGTTPAQIVHPEAKVRGFPTLLLFPAGEKKASVAFEGTRDLKTLVEFVKGRATVPFTLPEVSSLPIHPCTCVIDAIGFGWYDPYPRVLPP